MAIFNINSGHVSRPRVVHGGQLVSVTEMGGSARVEYTLGTLSDIQNGVAIWSDWPKGNVSVMTTDLMNNDGFIRVTAIGGNVTYEVNENPTDDKLAPFRSDWASQSGASLYGPTLGAPHAPYWGPVANCSMPCNQTNLTKFQAMGNAVRYFRVPVKQIKIRLPGWYVAQLSAPSDFTEANLGAPTLWRGAIAVPPGSPTPTQAVVEGGGGVTLSVAPGATGELIITLPNIMPEGTPFDCRLWQSNPNGIIFNGTGYGGPNDGLNTGVTTADLTMTNTALTSSFNGACLLPLQIIGITTADTEAYASDSIGAGTGDSPDVSGDLGIFARTFGKKIGYVNMGIGSDTAAKFATNSALRRAEMAYAKRVRLHYLTNDINTVSASVALTALQSCVDLFPNTVPVHIGTVIPRPSSTDGWTTVDNQTPWVQETRRRTVNRAIRQGFITGIAGIMDPCQVLESKYTALGVPALETGLFAAAAPLRTVTDGTATATSSTISSPTAAFSVNDTGQLISISGAGAAGVTIVGRMTYVSATQVTISNPQTGGTLTATANVTGTATLNIGCDRCTADGIHPNRQGNLVANRYP